MTSGRYPRWTAALGLLATLALAACGAETKVRQGPGEGPPSGSGMPTRTSPAAGPATAGPATPGPTDPAPAPTQTGSAPVDPGGSLSLDQLTQVMAAEFGAEVLHDSGVVNIAFDLPDTGALDQDVEAALQTLIDISHYIPRMDVSQDNLMIFARNPGENYNALISGTFDLAALRGPGAPADPWDAATTEEPFLSHEMWDRLGEYYRAVQSSMPFHPTTTDWTFPDPREGDTVGESGEELQATLFAATVTGLHPDENYLDGSLICADLSARYLGSSPTVLAPHSTLTLVRPSGAVEESFIVLVSGEMPSISSVREGDSVAGRVCFLDHLEPGLYVVVFDDGAGGDGAGGGGRAAWVFERTQE